MKHIPSSRAYYARSSGSTFGKVVGTIASILTVAAILFVGSRDWKSGKPLLSALVDVSDIQSIFSSLEKAGTTTTVKNAAIDAASNDIERSLIENGSLFRRSSQIVAGTSTAPAGLSREVVSR